MYTYEHEHNSEHICSSQLLESQCIQMQELRKSATGATVPSKSVTLYYIDLAWVTRVQVMIKKVIMIMTCLTMIIRMTMTLVLPASDCQTRSV